MRHRKLLKFSRGENKWRREDFDVGVFKIRIGKTFQTILERMRLWKQRRTVCAWPTRTVLGRDRGPRQPRLKTRFVPATPRAKALIAGGAPQPTAWGVPSCSGSCSPGACNA